MKELLISALLFVLSAVGVQSSQVRFVNYQTGWGGVCGGCMNPSALAQGIEINFGDLKPDGVTYGTIKSYTPQSPGFIYDVVILEPSGQTTFVREEYSAGPPPTQVRVGYRRGALTIELEIAGPWETQLTALARKYGVAEVTTGDHKVVIASLHPQGIVMSRYDFMKLWRTLTKEERDALVKPLSDAIARIRENLSGDDRHRFVNGRQMREFRNTLSQ